MEGRWRIAGWAKHVFSSQIFGAVCHTPDMTLSDSRRADETPTTKWGFNPVSLRSVEQRPVWRLYQFAQGKNLQLHLQRMAVQRRKASL